MNNQVNDQIIAIYDDIADDWARSHNQRDFWSHEVAILKTFLPDGRLIDVGCGGGRDATILTMAGYDYVGVEPSIKLLEFAIKSHPGDSFVQGNIFSLSQLDIQIFDDFWCAAVLLHIPHKQIDAALQQIKSVLKDGAVGFISVKEGNGVMSEVDGREFFLWQEADFTKLLGQNGFTILSYQYRPMSEKTNWLCYFVGKA